MRHLLNHLLEAVLTSGTQMITNVKNIFMLLKDIILNDSGQLRLAFSSVIFTIITLITWISSVFYLNTNSLKLSKGSFNILLVNGFIYFLLFEVQKKKTKWARRCLKPEMHPNPSVLWQIIGPWRNWLFSCSPSCSVCVLALFLIDASQQYVLAGALRTYTSKEGKKNALHWGLKLMWSRAPFDKDIHKRKSSKHFTECHFPLRKVNSLANFYRLPYPASATSHSY